MRYLKETIKAKLTFTKASSSNIVGYCYADWARDLDERRSCTGYVFVRQGGPISWTSKRQSTVALSSAEAEYMSLSACTQEAFWFRQFEMDFNSTNIGTPVNIYCDNKSAINSSETNGYNARTKHIDIRHRFVRHSVQENLVHVEYLSTEDMLADIFTKPLNQDKHLLCSKGFGMKF